MNNLHTDLKNLTILIRQIIHHFIFLENEAPEVSQSRFIYGLISFSISEKNLQLDEFQLKLPILKSFDCQM